MTLTLTLTETLPGWTWVRVSSLVSIGPAVWPAIRNIDHDRQTNKHNAFYHIDDADADEIAVLMCRWCLQWMLQSVQCHRCLTACMLTISLRLHSLHSVSLLFSRSVVSFWASWLTALHDCKILHVVCSGWPQTWKTWNTRGFIWTWKTQGIPCNLKEKL